MATTILFDIDEGLRNTVGSLPLRLYIVERVLEKLDRLEQDAVDHPGLLAELAARVFSRSMCPGIARSTLLWPRRRGHPSSGTFAPSGAALARADPARIEYLGIALSAEHLVVAINESIGKGRDIFPRQEDVVRRLAVMIDERPENDTLKQMYLSARQLLGKIYFKLAELERASREAEAALALARELAARNPENIDMRRTERATLLALALVRLHQGNCDESLAYTTESIRINESILGNVHAFHPDRQASIHAYMNLGSIHMKLRHFDEAQSSMERAIGLQKQWLEVDPANVAARQGAAAMLRELTWVLRQLGRLADVQSRLHEALACLEPLAGSEHSSVVATFAAVYLDLGNAERELGNLPAAENAYERHLHFAKRCAAFIPTRTCLCGS